MIQVEKIKDSEKVSEGTGCCLGLRDKARVGLSCERVVEREERGCQRAQ